MSEIVGSWMWCPGRGNVSTLYPDRECLLTGLGQDLMPGPHRHHFFRRSSNPTPILHSEDIQPNEAINKRKHNQPPVIMAIAGPQRHKPVRVKG